MKNTILLATVALLFISACAEKTPTLTGGVTAGPILMSELVSATKNGPVSGTAHDDRYREQTLDEARGAGDSGILEAVRCTALDCIR